MLVRGLQITVVFDEAPSPSDPLARIRFGQVRACPQKALRGGIPSPFLEPFPRSWSHFFADCCQRLTNLVKIDFEIPRRRALRATCRRHAQCPCAQMPLCAAWSAAWEARRGVSGLIAIKRPGRVPQHRALRATPNPRPQGVQHGPIIVLEMAWVR